LIPFPQKKYKTIYADPPWPEMREAIELVSHPPYIELFARERFDGWDAWGNEISNEQQLMLGGK